MGRRTKPRIPAFIATLGMMNIYLAFTFIWTEGSRVIAVSDPTFGLLGTGTLFGLLPIPFLAMIVTYVVCYGILNGSIYGRCLRAVGSSEIAARTAGLSVDLIRILAFAIVGGRIRTSLSISDRGSILSEPTMASGDELTVIAVVVIGGTSLKGGENKVAFSVHSRALCFSL